MCFIAWSFFGTLLYQFTILRLMAKKRPKIKKLYLKDFLIALPFGIFPPIVILLSMLLIKFQKSSN